MSTPQRWLSLVFVAVLVAVPVRAADLNPFLPDDTEIIVGINVTTAIESGLVQKHVPALVKKYGPEIVNLAVAAGLKIDEESQKELLKFIGDADAIQQWLNKYKTVIRRVLITTSADFDDSNAFLIFEGDFNKDRMKEMFDDVAKRKPFGVVVETVKQGKHQFYSLKVAGDNDAMYVALADNKTLVWCQDKEALAKALDGANREKPGRKELIAEANKIDAKASIWMAAVPKEADEYVAAHGFLVLTNGIRLTAAITSKDDEHTKKMVDDMKDQLKDVVEGLDAAAKQLAPLGVLRDLLKMVEPKAEKNVVTVEVEIPGATLDKIIKELPTLR